VIVPAAPAWISIREEERSVVHVIPIDDIVIHVMSERCVCGVRWEAVRCDCGGDGCVHVAGWLFSHQSLDGREQVE
jgi:hypothetical protein